MKKIIAVLLIISLLCLYGNLYAKDKRGADLVIQKKDGQQVSGELIAAKKSSLLLKESNSGSDVSVDVNEVMRIKIRKKSKALLGAGLGLLVGGGLLYGVYANSPKNQKGDEEAASLSVLIFPLALFGGILIGALAGSDKKIRIEGKSDSEVQEVLEDLRKKARVPDFQ